MHHKLFVLTDVNYGGEYQLEYLTMREAQLRNVKLRATDSNLEWLPENPDHCEWNMP